MYREDYQAGLAPSFASQKSQYYNFMQGLRLAPVPLAHRALCFSFCNTPCIFHFFGSQSVCPLYLHKLLFHLLLKWSLIVTAMPRLLGAPCGLEMACSFGSGWKWLCGLGQIPQPLCTLVPLCIRQNWRCPSQGLRQLNGGSKAPSCFIHIKMGFKVRGNCWQLAESLFFLLPLLSGIPEGK